MAKPIHAEGNSSHNIQILCIKPIHAEGKSFPLGVDKNTHWVYNKDTKKARPQTVMPKD